MIETIIVIMFICIMFIFIKVNKVEVLFNESFDKNYYLVRNLPDKQEAANLLGEIRSKLKKLSNYCYNLKQKGYDKDFAKYVKRIYDKIDTVEIRESSANNKYTSYSVNKGEELVFCIRSKKTNKLHDINKIMYVAIHEISHIGSTETGHTELFNKINKYMLKKGIELGVYKYENYSMNPVEYCGLTLNNNIINNYL